MLGGEHRIPIFREYIGGQLKRIVKPQGIFLYNS